MTLYWPDDPNTIDLTTPKLHALIIGVGDYQHLGINATKPASFLNGLAPLTITQPAAKKIARWLETTYENPACPRGSIELLLSPTENLQRADGSPVAIEAATVTNITAAFKRWYDRCHTHPDNIAFFYFAGHGISTLSHFLLPADFGNPDFPDDWENTIDFSGLQVGMAKCKAQTQLFFIDACRDAPIDALTQRNPHGKSLVTSTFQDKVALSAAYFAASEGRQAYGRDGEETYFCKALLMCLDGVGARKAGPAKWLIDAASLSNALVSVVRAMAATENLPLSSDCRVQKPVPLHYPPGGVAIITVACQPDQANAESSIRVSQGLKDVHVSAVGERRPWMGGVNYGDTTVEVTFTNFPKEVITDQMVQPIYDVRVER